MVKFLLVYFSMVFCLMPAMVFAIPQDKNFLYFKFLEMKKEKNGQVSQAIELVCTDPAVGAVKVFYRENSDPAVFFAPVKDGIVTLIVDKPSRISLFAFSTNPAGFPEKKLVAHTNLVLFGKSSVPAPRIMADDIDVNRFAGLPGIELLSSENYYWHQTGQVLKFCIKPVLEPDSSDIDPGNIRIFVLENHKIRRLTMDGTLDFSYDPAHDERLRKTGVTAIRQDILYTTMEEKNQKYFLTYSLLLHRSRKGFNDIFSGVSVLGTSMILFIGLILKKRRTPW
ncbi:MAG: hypothetical protein GY710_04330 [Desulfobacteraceae bacterium]|nr:hypothetical protein [Desulfobacteraceae bacterium]